MVAHASSTAGIMHVNVTMTLSSVKVKVTGLLNFRKLAKPCMLAAMTVSPLAGLSGLTVKIRLSAILYCQKFTFFDLGRG